MGKPISTSQGSERVPLMPSRCCALESLWQRSFREPRNCRPSRKRDNPSGDGFVWHTGSLDSGKARDGPRKLGLVRQTPRGNRLSVFSEN